MFSDELKTFRRLGFRHFLLQILNFASVIASGLMLWKGLGLILNTESPIVVVLSGSMEPAFYRGDLLFLTNPPGQRYHTGDITVYRIPGAEIPIVHRVLETRDVFIPFDNSTENRIVNNRLAKLKLPPGEHQLMLTKGDNNHVDDIDLYRGLEWLDRRHIIGKVRGFLPYIGYVTIAMNDFPQLKYALLGGLGLLAVIQRE
ncbi:uncharacterized protein F5891DRAFT_1146117 [Suillus fuscotomentosus]|uniref:Signal peptidase complex catalytic subunit SEC11 n=1 Tax=Suillus fuscotomentosus TaxID=1912939 RepID=A0AAD4E5T1_9AGAM|nr:uncharacterized protein F5891DRAFT_1146117 [Suillus fuscotomentosus]KAG1856200.1 hypothetical protein C8R48DRAFT_608454 [Suillus tomentosus]KAG1900234.1 hypothetical protein F5891DRAFT_1146117 [Suillus fuscotomentosus]KAG2051897.1 hypothetical protein BDR06DRAFT_570140 [Suillus hirtellus]